MLKVKITYAHPESGSEEYQRIELPEGMLRRGVSTGGVTYVPKRIELDATQCPTGVEVALMPGGEWMLSGGGLATAMAETHCTCCINGSSERGTPEHQDWSG